MGNDNQYNVTVTVRDPKGNQAHLTSRVDGLIGDFGEVMMQRRWDLHSHYHATLIFYAIQSGDKSMEDAELQLMTSLKCIAHFTGKLVVYGFVIPKAFHIVKLVKYQDRAYLADGEVHITAVGALVDEIACKRIQ